MTILNIFKRRHPLVAQRPVCGECGKPGLEVHAMLNWNEAIQDWQIREVYDRGSCSECGNTDVSIRYVN
jgi:hypothetical protein